MSPDVAYSLTFQICDRECGTSQVYLADLMGLSANVTEGMDSDEPISNFIQVGKACACSQDKHTYEPDVG